MILITGASGNVGREVLAQAAKTGHRIRAAFQSQSKAIVPNGVEAVILDYNQPDTLRSAIQDVDAVFLVGPPTDQLVPLERKAADVLAESKVRRVVKLSAMGGRDAVFTRQHAQSEDYIRAKNLPFTFLRPNGFMQNLVNYSAATIRSMGKFFGSEGEGRISLIDIRDIAAVAVKTLVEEGHLGKVYTLTGPQALSNYEVAHTLSQVLHRQIEFVNLAPAELKSSLLAAGVPEWSADAMIDLQRLYREGKASEVTEDVERVLERKPRALRQFLIDNQSSFA